MRESQKRQRGQISFELILLSGLVSLGVVLGLQTLAADTGEGALTSACRLLQKVGLGAGDCGSGEGTKTEHGDHDLGVSQHALTTPDQDIVTVRNGVHEAGSLELPQDVIAGLTAGLPTVESSFTGQEFRVASVAENLFQQPRPGPGQQTGPRLVWNNPNDPRRTPPRRGPGIGRALGWAGLALAAMAIGKEWADDSMPPQLVVPIDDLNGVLLDWQLGGPVLLGIVSDGETSELRGLAMLDRSTGILEATSSNGTVFAEKPLAAEEWTLHLSALPEELAERIREQPALVWDSEQYRDLPAPLLAPQPGTDYVEFNGVLYVRNLETGTLTPFMLMPASGPADPNAATMAAGPPGSGDGPGGRAEGEEGEPEDEPPEEAPDGVEVAADSPRPRVGPLNLRQDLYEAVREAMLTVLFPDDRRPNATQELADLVCGEYACMAVVGRPEDIGGPDSPAHEQVWTMFLSGHNALPANPLPGVSSERGEEFQSVLELARGAKDLGAPAITVSYVTGIGEWHALDVTPEMVLAVREMIEFNMRRYGTGGIVFGHSASGIIAAIAIEGGRYRGVDLGPSLAESTGLVAMASPFAGFTVDPVTAAELGTRETITTVGLTQRWMIAAAHRQMEVMLRGASNPWDFAGAFLRGTEAAHQTVSDAMWMLQQMGTRAASVAALDKPIKAALAFRGHVITVAGARDPFVDPSSAEHPSAVEHMVIPGRGHFRVTSELEIVERALEQLAPRVGGPLPRR